MGVCLTLTDQFDGPSERVELRSGRCQRDIPDVTFETRSGRPVLVVASNLDGTVRSRGCFALNHVKIALTGNTFWHAFEEMCRSPKVAFLVRPTKLRNILREAARRRPGEASPYFEDPEARDAAWRVEVEDIKAAIRQLNEDARHYGTRKVLLSDLLDALDPHE